MDVAAVVLRQHSASGSHSWLSLEQKNNKKRNYKREEERGREEGRKGWREGVRHIRL